MLCAEGDDMTFDEFIEIGRLRAKSPQYRKKRDASIELAARELITHERPYLSLSGGKDSTAMAFIVNEAAIQVNREFRVWCHVSDASFPGTIETVKAVCDRIHRPLDLYRCPVSAFELVKSKQRRPFGKSGAFFDSIRTYADDKDLCFVGVRACESKRRMKAAKIHGAVYQSKSMGKVTTCVPLQWFRLEDVAAALYEFQAPIHPIYHKQAIDNGKNVNDETQWIRLNYVTSKDLLNKGTAVFLKLNYPELYNKLRAAYPEVGLYA